MANLQVKGVPDSIHRRLRKMAANRGQTLGEYVLEAVEDRLKREEFYQRLSKRKSVRLSIPTWKMVEEARALRDKELENQRL